MSDELIGDAISKEEVILYLKAQIRYWEWVDDKNTKDCVSTLNWAVETISALPPLEDRVTPAPPVAPTPDETSKWCIESHSVTSQFSAPHLRTERCDQPRDSRLASPAPSVGELEWREEITRGNLLTWTIWKALSKSAKFEIDAGIGGENSGVASLRVEITELFDSIPAAKSLANSLQRILSGAAEEGEAK